MSQVDSGRRPLAIVCERVSKQFPHQPRPAVDEVSLQVEDGEFVVLLGPSGCGKTTLLKMINRLIEPTGGRILVHGRAAGEVPPTELRRRIGYVIQQVGLFPHMTIEQNIAVVPDLLHWDKQKTSARTDGLLDLVDLPRAYRQRYPRQLSGGEQQRVGLARALAADPELMLMDEPFAAIDAITRLSLQDELLSIHRKLHKTIVFVTHDVEEALRLADKIAVMQAGRLVQYGTPLQVMTRPASSFVEELVGACNVLRRLSLIRVGDALAAQQTPDGPRLAGTGCGGAGAELGPDDDLRSALSRLLESEAGPVAVVDGTGQRLGLIRFDDIRAAIGLVEPSGQDGD